MPLVLQASEGLAPILDWKISISSNSPASMALVGDQLVVLTEKAVVALDADTGKQNWLVEHREGFWPRSLATSTALVAVGSPNKVIVMSIIDGSLLWQQELVGELLWPPTIAGNHLFVGTAFVGPGISPQPSRKAWAYGFDVISGEPLWTFETDTYTQVTPAVNQDRVVFAGSRLAGPGEADIDEGGYSQFYAVSKHSGELKWTVSRKEGFIKSLAIDDTHLYFLAYADALFALDISDGDEVWKYSTENWSPGFTLDNGTLYFGSDNAFVHAVEAKSGTAKFRAPLEGVFNAPRTAPVVRGHDLYFQGNNNRLYCMTVDTGQLLWKTEPLDRPRVAPEISSDRYFVLGRNGELSLLN